MASKEFPYIPPELLRRLEEAFPDKAFRPDADTPTTPDALGLKVMAQAGTMAVLDLLRHHFDKQQSPQRTTT